jgi:hypothetical protein
MPIPTADRAELRNKSRNKEPVRKETIRADVPMPVIA